MFHALYYKYKIIHIFEPKSQKYQYNYLLAFGCILSLVVSNDWNVHFDLVHHTFTLNNCFTMVNEGVGGHQSCSER
jgi:hypothetical protein